ncbi:MAG TPA: YCF48-related protein [Candidatus Binatia bacterium]|nr:YCF48-related protein [Candidatus Binatia bacterium]
MSGPGRRAGVYLLLGLLAPAIARAALVRDNLYGVKALSASEAWAVGTFGSIYHTTNAGQTWETRESGTRNPLFSVDFADPQHGWAVGKSAIILRTVDGGASWKPQRSPIPPEKHLFKVQALDVRTAWAVGDWGARTVTHDGGEHWEDRSLGEDVVLYDVSFPDAEHGYVCGEFGTVLATADGGATWEKRAAGTEKTLFGLDFVTPDEGWAVGIDGLLLHTRDGGRSWAVQRGKVQAESLDEFGFLEAMSNPGLYAVRVLGEYGVVVGDTGTVLVSTDAGQSWRRLELPSSRGLAWMRDVSLVPGTEGIAIGAEGFAVRFDRGQVTLPDGAPATAAATP